MEYSKGFTLAEVLLTLIIIGVIASLTITDLLPNIQEAQYKTAWKSIFSDFSQAAKRVTLDNAGSLAGVFQNNDDFRNEFIPYLSVIKTCDAYTPVGPAGCWHSATGWKYLSGYIVNVGQTWESRLILNNGILVYFQLDSTDCNSTDTPNNDECGRIHFDVNGFNPPNTIGRDIFAVRITKSGQLVPFGASQGNSQYIPPAADSCDVKKYPTTNGWSCSADYLMNKSY